MGDVTGAQLSLFVIEQVDQKRCTTCRKIKKLTEFSWGRDAFGKKWECKACNVIALRVWRNDPINRARHDRSRRNYRLRTDYGIDIDQFEKMVVDQGGLCAICVKPPSAKGLHVDHHHSSGIVRKLLCGGCNMGLGQFRDDPAILRAAAEYLEDQARRIDDHIRLGRLAL